MSEEEISGLKELGNEQFKNGEFVLAIVSYSKAIDKFGGTARQSLTGERGLLLAALLGNRAACRLKVLTSVAVRNAADIQSCIEDCDGALELNPIFGKALYRKAQVLLLKPDIRGALKEIARLLHFEPKKC